jgi:hypothetical protein
MSKINQKSKKLIPSGVLCIASVTVLFGYLGIIMGVPNMLNTIMKTAHDLLLNTVFYLMSICVITGALGRVFVEFGVVALLERTLRPLMRNKTIVEARHHRTVLEEVGLMACGTVHKVELE